MLQSRLYIPINYKQKIDKAVKDILMLCNKRTLQTVVLSTKKL